jgi:hypothetical protein
VSKGEKFEAKSGQIPADVLTHALRREWRAENRFFGRLFDHIGILSGSNHRLNGQLTLVRATKKTDALTAVRPKPAEAVRKRESTRFSGVALPFPSCCQANTARTEGWSFWNLAFSMRFHTASATIGHSTGLGERHLLGPHEPSYRRHLSSALTCSATGVENDPVC